MTLHDLIFFFFNFHLKHNIEYLYTKIVHIIILYCYFNYNIQLSSDINKCIQLLKSPL